MDNFVFTPELQRNVKALFADTSFDISKLRDVVDCYFDPDELKDNVTQWVNESPASAPLLALIDGNESEALRFEQNVEVAREFCEGLYRYFEEDHEDPMYLMTMNNPDLKELCFIFSGAYVIQFLGPRLLKIDYKEYSFHSAKQMFYVLGAHLSNLLRRQEHREVEIPIANSDSIYLYDNDTHGDFRLSHYDISAKQMLNPFNLDESLPFGMPERKGIIAGYHSVEGSFLASLLCFLHYKTNLAHELQDIDSFLEPYYKQGQQFGNYADAGCFSSGSASFAFIGFDQMEPAKIYTMGDAYYDPVFEDEALSFYARVNVNDKNPKLIMSICKDSVMPLIKGLLQKVTVGNGRSSIKELELILRHYLNNYAKQAA